MDDEKVVAIDADGNLVAVSLNEMRAEWVRRCIDRVKSGCAKDGDFELLLENLARPYVQAFLQASWKQAATTDPKHKWEEFGRKVGAIIRGRKGRRHRNMGEIRPIFARYIELKETGLNQEESVRLQTNGTDLISD